MPQKVQEKCEAQRCGTVSFEEAAATPNWICRSQASGKQPPNRGGCLLLK